MTTALDLARRLGTPGAIPLLTGDFGREGDYPDTAEPTLAAVLVALVDRTEPTILLTRRHAGLRQHPGQVALPGGRIDAGEDAPAAALREAWEEVALPPDAATLHGLGEPYRTGTNFSVTPVIATVPPDLPLRANESEVDAVFELPASRLLDPSHYEEQRGEWRGRTRRFWALTGGRDEERVWGATAGILLNLARRLA